MRNARVQVVDASPLSLVLILVPFSILYWLANWIGFRVPDGLLPARVRQLRDSDVLLDVFGISFADGREIFLPFNVLSLMPAFLLQVPVVKLAQALGPFENPLNRIAARQVLRRCKKIFARGDDTLAHLHKLRLHPASQDIADDLAFLYEESFSLSSENTTRVSDLGHALRGSRVVAICPSSVVHRKAKARKYDYLGLLSELARRAVIDGYKVLILPHATRQGLATLRNNDLPVVGLLRQRCARELSAEELSRICWVDFDINSASIRELLQLCSLVVTSRFHAMVAALAVGVPPIVLGWGHKYAEVARNFCLEDSCFDIDGLDAETVYTRFELMITPAFKVSWSGKERLASVKLSAARQFEEIAMLLAGSSEMHPKAATQSKRSCS